MRLPTNIAIGAGTAVVESIRTRFSTAEEVLQDLVETKGYIAFDVPKYQCPQLTTDMLTTPDLRSYTETFVMFKAWRDFYSERLAEARNQVLQNKNILSIIEISTKKSLREQFRARGEKPTVDQLKEMVKENEEYSDALLELQRSTQTKDLLEAKFDSLDRSLAVISRQVEIKKMDMEQTYQQSNMPGRNFPPRSY